MHEVNFFRGRGVGYHPPSRCASCGVDMVAGATNCISCGAPADTAEQAQRLFRDALLALQSGDRDRALLLSQAAFHIDPGCRLPQDLQKLATRQSAEQWCEQFDHALAAGDLGKAALFLDMAEVQGGEHRITDLRRRYREASAQRNAKLAEVQLLFDQHRYADAKATVFKVLRDYPSDAQANRLHQRASEELSQRRRAAMRRIAVALALVASVASVAAYGYHDTQSKIVGSKDQLARGDWDGARASLDSVWFPLLQRDELARLQQAARQLAATRDLEARDPVAAVSAYRRVADHWKASQWVAAVLKAAERLDRQIRGELLATAKAARDQGDWIATEKAALQALKGFPDDREAKEMLVQAQGALYAMFISQARERLQRGESAAAIKCADEALKRRPGDAEATRLRDAARLAELLASARTAMNKGDSIAAEKPALDAVTAFPDCNEAKEILLQAQEALYAMFMSRANEAVQRGEFAAAVKDADEALKRRPRDVEATRLRNATQSALVRGEYDTSMAQARQASDQREWSAAFRAAERAVNLLPDDRDALTLMRQIAPRAVEQAMRDEERRIEQLPSARRTAVETLCQEIARAIAAQNWRSARTACEYLLEKDPANLRARVELARVLVCDGAYEEALRALAEARVASPADGGLCAMTAFAEMKLNRTNEAIESLCAALRRGSLDVSLLPGPIPRSYLEHPKVAALRK